MKPEPSRTEDKVHKSQIFQGQIAYVMIIKINRCAPGGGARSFQEPNFPRPDNFCYNTVLKKHKWRDAGARESQIPNIPRLDYLCYDNEDVHVGNESN